MIRGSFYITFNELCSAFALNKWLRDGRALLKTSRGARLTATPWHREE